MKTSTAVLLTLAGVGGSAAVGYYFYRKAHPTAAAPTSTATHPATPGTSSSGGLLSQFGSAWTSGASAVSSFWDSIGLGTGNNTPTSTAPPTGGASIVTPAGIDTSSPDDGGAFNTDPNGYNSSTDYIDG